MSLSAVCETTNSGIEKRFIELFTEYEAGHLQLRERLDGFSGLNGDLEAALASELDRFEAWRYPLTFEMGKITANLDGLGRLDYISYINRTSYHKIVQVSPFYWRIMNKPNGYAGDARMMEFIYENRFEGATPFGMFLHKHACATKSCQAVRNRRVFLKDQILKLPGGNILSFAAGPAREILDVIETCKDKRYQFFALDHDMDTLTRTNHKAFRPHTFKYALANAFHFISGNYRTARPRPGMHKYCNPSKDFGGRWLFFNAVKYKFKSLKSDTFDLVYTAGLYDYIKTHTFDINKGTVALTKNLFRLVKPGGFLIIGNFSHKNPTDLKFAMEFIYDWKLIYRDSYEMFDFAKSIPEKSIKNIELLEEPLGINYFLKINKK